MTNTLEKIHLEHGLDVDIDLAFIKLRDRQFGGNPGKGLKELIQNALDSYVSSTELFDRIIDIRINRKSISITDWGEGLSINQLKLITTMGGTDKAANANKIGQFGIGFFAMFAKALETKKITVTTRCEKDTVEIVFDVKHPDKRPEITTRILSENKDYSTKIDVDFGTKSAPQRCHVAANDCLKYYPCSATINGSPAKSIWLNKNRHGAITFDEQQCDGFIDYGSYSGTGVELLCKYEHIMNLDLGSLSTGGHNSHYDLRDYKRRNMPYIDGAKVIVNSNRLNVTISRDSFTMDGAYTSMLKVISSALTKKLGRTLEGDIDTNHDLIISNQFTLCNKLDDLIDKLESESNEKIVLSEDEQVYLTLLEAKVYRLNGKVKSVSIMDLRRLRTEDWPVFFAPNKSNLNWLGGAFKRDFIVLPPNCVRNPPPKMYESILNKLVGDTVNLDTVRDDQSAIGRLVKRNIISRESLQPKIEMLRPMNLTEKEQDFLDEIENLISNNTIRDAVQRNIFIKVKKFKLSYFDLNDKKMEVSAGLLDNNGNIINEVSETNRHRNVHLALNRDDAFIRKMVNSNNPQRAYYTLTYLSHQLAACQRNLVPDTPQFYFIRGSLSADIRKALINSLTPDYIEESA